MVYVYSLSNIHDIIGHKWVYEFTNTHQNEHWIIYNKGEIELNQKTPPTPLNIGGRVFVESPTPILATKTCLLTRYGLFFIGIYTYIYHGYLTSVLVGLDAPEGRKVVRGPDVGLAIHG